MQQKEHLANVNVLCGKCWLRIATSFKIEDAWANAWCDECRSPEQPKLRLIQGGKK